MKNTAKPFVTVKEAAEASGMSVHFWRKGLAQGWVPHVKSGNKFYIDYQRAISILRGEETA